MSCEICEAHNEALRLALQRIESVAANEEIEYEDACDKIWQIASDALKAAR